MDNNEEIEQLEDSFFDDASNYSNNLTKFTPKPTIKNINKSSQKNINEVKNQTIANTGNTVKNTGKAIKNTGKTIEGTGKVMQGAGTVMQGTGKVAQGAGKAASSAGDAMMKAGTSLSSTGLGAIAGVPLAIGGGAAKVAGEGTNLAGKGVEKSGSFLKTTGKGVEQTGKQVKNAGKNIEQKGKNIATSVKSKNKAKVDTKFFSSGKQSKKIILIGGIGGGIVLLFLLLIVFCVVFHWLLNIFSSTSLVGIPTAVVDETKLMKDINEIYEIHEYDEDLNKDGELDYLYVEENASTNNMFQELKRQRYIWVDDYKQFGIIHNVGNPFLVIDEFQTNDIDLANIIVTIHHQGLINLVSYDQDFNDDYDDLVVDSDGTKLNEYEKENIVNNRDTRDYYEQAKEKLGSTFFLYPGVREMFGNSISAEVTWQPAKAVYKIDSTGTRVVSIVNIGLIMSDYHVLAKMSLKDEFEYQTYSDPKRFPKGPYTDLGYFIKALDDGYNNCFFEPDQTLQNWTWLNVCNDYKLLFEEVEYLENYNTHITNEDQLQAIINNAVPETHNLKYAIFPQYETQEDGRIAHNFHDDIKKVEEELAKNPKPNATVAGFQYFIEVTVDRYYNEKLYEKYLKELYIPYVYINYEGSGYENSPSSIQESMIEQTYNEIKLLERAYRDYNGGEVTKLNGSTGNSIISGSTFTCGETPVYVSDEYCSDGNCRSHNAADVTTSVKHPNIRPLLGGKVYSVYNSCSNSPTCPVSEALAYTKGTSLSSLSAACQCGGGLGNHVVIESTYNGKIYYTVYAHLSAVNVSAGDEVTPDTIIGVMGTTGVSTGDHLHIEMHEGDRWSQKFSPTNLFSNAIVGSVVCNNKVDDSDDKKEV